MKLTRKHELLLIDLGMRQVLDNLLPKPKAKKKVATKTIGRKWTKAQRKKFAESMKKKWTAKRKQ